MDDTKKDFDPLLEASELMTLVELQKFLADELADTTDASFTRAFMPLTDGLGLESPKIKEPTSHGKSAPKTTSVPQSVKPAPIVVKPPTSEATPKSKERLEALFDTDPISPAALKSTLDSPKPARAPFAPVTEDLGRQERAKLETLRREEERRIKEIAQKEKEQTQEMKVVVPTPAKIANPFVKKEPPPLPAPGVFRRMASGFLDEVFVWTLWGMALAITSHVLNPSIPLFSMEIIKEFQHPQFVRFAVLEFATLWLAYYAFGVGVLDMTFGMWVWGMRIAYLGADSESRFFRKLFRTLLSFMIFAPVVPVLLLAIRWKNRNVLDRATGTLLYQSTV